MDHSGNYYKVNARLYDPPTQTIPLLMAGNGRRQCVAAGNMRTDSLPIPKPGKEHKDEFQKGASDAGKDPARMPVFIEQYVVGGRQKRANEAAKLGVSVPRPGNPISIFAIRKPFRTAPNLRSLSKK